MIEPRLSSMNIVILQAECVVGDDDGVDDSNGSNNNNRQHQQTGDASQASRRAWNKALETASVHCDLFFESDVSHSSSSVLMKQQPQSETGAQMNETSNAGHADQDDGDDPTETLREQHLELRRKLFALDDDDDGTGGSAVVQVIRNKALHRCGFPRDWQVLRALASVQGLSLANCHLILLASSSSGSGAAAYSLGDKSNSNETMITTTTPRMSSNEPSSATAAVANHLYLPVTPLPNQFSWQEAKPPKTGGSQELRVKMDLARAKDTYVEAWNTAAAATAAANQRMAVVTTNINAVEVEAGSTAAQTIHDAITIESRYDNSTAKDGSSFDTASERERASLAAGAACPSTATNKIEDNFERLWHASLNSNINNNNACPICDDHSSTTSLFQQNMELMMKREMTDITIILTVVLTIFIGWMTLQIAHENKHRQWHHRFNGDGSKGSPKTSTKTTDGKEKNGLPVEELAVGSMGGKDRYLPMLLSPSSSDGTISPLSLDPLLAKSQESSLLDQQLAPSQLSPCSKLQVQWWNNRAARRLNRRQTTSIIAPPPQSSDSGAPLPTEDDQHTEQRADLNKNNSSKRFLLHPVENQISPIASPNRSFLAEGDPDPPTLLNEPAAKSLGDIIMSPKQPSSFLDELKSKVQPRRVLNPKENKPQRIVASVMVTPETIPSVAPISHTRSFMEDYW